MGCVVWDGMWWYGMEDGAWGVWYGMECGGMGWRTAHGVWNGVWWWCVVWCVVVVFGMVCGGVWHDGVVCDRCSVVWHGLVW